MLVCSGCIVEHDGPPPNGILVVDWTVDGTTDPSRCDQADAASAQVTVSDLNGDTIGTFEQSCSAFAESISLQDGDYTASAVLVDANGKPRTTTVPINRFSIFGGDELDIPVDFPADSFL